MRARKELMMSKRITWTRIYRRFLSQVLDTCSGTYLDDKQSKHEHYWLISQLGRLRTGRVRVLDVGCGGGFFLSRLKKEIPSCRSCGIDISKPVLRNARKHSDSDFVCSTAEKLPFRDNSFDVVVCQNVLHHIVGNTRQSSAEKARKVVCQIKSLLKSGGRLLIIEQSFNSKVLSHMSFLYTSLLAFLHYQPKVSFLNPSEIYRFLEAPATRAEEISWNSGISSWFVRMYIVWDHLHPKRSRSTARTSRACMQNSITKYQKNIK